MNTNKIASPEAELKSALDAFETCLVRPIVSGELSPWIDEVQKAWAEAHCASSFSHDASPPAAV